jgi:hypothetical protein
MDRKRRFNTILNLPKTVATNLEKIRGNKKCNLSWVTLLLRMQEVLNSNLLTGIDYLD